MKVIIDERERELYDKSYSIVQANNTYVVLSKEVLPLGDIFITTDENKHVMLIERKTLQDLLASIKDGRYEEQSYRLMHSSGLPPHSILYIIEGQLSQLRSNIERKIVYSALTSLNFFKGFSVIRTNNVNETAEYIVWMSEKIERNFLKCVFPYYLQPQYCKYMQMPDDIDKQIENGLTLEDVEDVEDVEKTKETNETKETKETATLENTLRTEHNSMLPSIKTAEISPKKGELFTYPQEVLDKQQTEFSAANYCNVVKKVKKDNVTPENIGEIILCQIPGISSVTAIAIMKNFSSFPDCIKQLQDNPDCLNNIVYETKGKIRKISKSCVENIKKYLL
jgi:ERCC4-type nuclease